MTSQFCPLHSKLLSDIYRIGWHTIGVFSLDGNSDTWSSSVGLFHSFGHPEVIVFGLPLRTVVQAINCVGEQILAGRAFQAGDEFKGFFEDPWESAFHLVDPSAYEERVGQALWFYEDRPFPLLQLVWSDEEQHLPWDAECDEYAKSSQPLLFTPPCSPSANDSRQ